MGAYLDFRAAVALAADILLVVHFVTALAHRLMAEIFATCLPTKRPLQMQQKLVQFMQFQSSNANKNENE